MHVIMSIIKDMNINSYVNNDFDMNILIHIVWNFSGVQSECL